MSTFDAPLSSANPTLTMYSFGSPPAEQFLVPLYIQFLVLLPSSREDTKTSEDIKPHVLGQEVGRGSRHGP